MYKIYFIKHYPACKFLPALIQQFCGFQKNEQTSQQSWYKMYLNLFASVIHHMSTLNRVYYRTVSNSALISTVHTTLSSGPEEFNSSGNSGTWQAKLNSSLCWWWILLFSGIRYNSTDTSIFLSIPQKNSKKSGLFFIFVTVQRYHCFQTPTCCTIYLQIKHMLKYVRLVH